MYGGVRGGASDDPAYSMSRDLSLIRSCLAGSLSCFIALEIIGLCPVGGALAPLPASLRAEKGEVG